MTSDTTYACIRNDTGLMAEMCHVSPMYMRCGPTTRGRHEESRQTRTQRTDERQARRAAAIQCQAVNFLRFEAAS